MPHHFLLIDIDTDTGPIAARTTEGSVVVSAGRGVNLRASDPAGLVVWLEDAATAVRDAHAEQEKEQSAPVAS